MVFLSDEWWVMSDENWVTKKVCPNRLLGFITSVFSLHHFSLCSSSLRSSLFTIFFIFFSRRLFADPSSVFADPSMVIGCSWVWLGFGFDGFGSNGFWVDQWFVDGLICGWWFWLWNRHGSVGCKIGMGPVVVRLAWIGVGGVGHGWWVLAVGMGGAGFAC